MGDPLLLRRLLLVVAGLALLAVDVFELAGGVTLQGWSSVAGVVCLVVAFWFAIGRGWRWVGQYAGPLAGVAFVLAAVGLFTSRTLWTAGLVVLTVLGVRWAIVKARGRPSPASP